MVFLDKKFIWMNILDSQHRMLGETFFLCGHGTKSESAILPRNLWPS